MAEARRVLGKYEILGEIGRGGFGAVYEALDTTLKRRVVLKILAPHLVWHPEFVERFRREAQIPASLRHPNIVVIHEIGEEQGQHYIAMEYLPGRPLDRMIAEGGGLPLAQVLSIAEQVASALDYAHERALIHRDVKPSNIIVDERGRAVLTDFGLVRAAETSGLSTTGQTIGTPEYMSPEQAEGEEVDWRSDLYSLGVVVYEMCVGRVPFKADTPLAVLRAQADREPPRPRDLSPSLPQAVEEVLLRALAKRPEDRYQSAGQLAEALKLALAAEEEAGKPREELAHIHAGVPQGPAMEPRPKEREQEQRGLAGAAEALQTKARGRDWRAMLKWAAPVVAALILFIGIRSVVDVISQQREVVQDAQALSATQTAMVRVEPTATSHPARTDTPLLPTSPTVTPPPMPVAGSTRVWDKDGSTMVYVPAGEFLMGSEGNPDAQVQERPQHSVYLDAFWIDQTEVTNEQYRQCVESGTCRAPTTCDWGEPTYPDPSKTHHPVVCVSWEDANDYCAWAHKRLPTEAEWEKAARGTDRRIYPWGNEFDCHRANLDDETEFDDYVGPGGEGCDGFPRTAPVGRFPSGESPYGALDMAGNVWEWCEDWYDEDYYSRSADRNPTGPDSGGGRVLRGGSWDLSRIGARCTSRGWYYPVGRHVSLGFRCCVGPTSSP